MRPSLALVVATLLLPSVLAVTGCGGTTVNRLDAKTDVDLSGNWNAGDSRRVAEAVIAQALQNPFADDFKRANNRVPVVKIGRIKVVTNGDLVNTDIFANDLVRALLNSGKVQAVASNAEVDQAREERKDQDVNASEKTRKESFQETGADYLIIGAINVQDDQEGGTRHKYYSADLKLIDIKTQLMVCPMNEKISKIVRR